MDYPDEWSNGYHVMMDSEELVTVRWDQVVMAEPDGELLIEINGPEDEALDPIEDGPVPVPAGPLDGVPAEAAADGQPEPVLRQDAAQVAARIREVAARPGIGGYRKIAAALLADHGIDVSHMKVKRVLAKTLKNGRRATEEMTKALR